MAVDEALPSAAPATSPSGGRKGITRSMLALCLLFLVAVGPFVQDLTAQGAPRLALTGALVDDGDIKIDDYLVGFDFTERDGHTYSDKAPGQELAALPFYAASQVVGAEPALVRRVHENLTLWWVTLCTSVIPVLGIVLLADGALRRRRLRLAGAAAFTFVFGTMLLPFSTNLYGHVLGALLGYAAWVVLDRTEVSSLRAGLLIGTLVGAGVVVEYPLAIVGLVLAIALAARRHWSTLVGFAVAGVPWAVFLGIYQNAAFGSPFSSGYSSKSYHQGATLLITGVPKLSTLAELLLGSRGMLVFTPIVGVGIFGLVQRWRRTRDEGAVIALAVTVGFIALQAGWVNAWGGDGPGPRYVIPMLPFLALGLAEIWVEVAPPLRRFIVGISVVSMGMATITLHVIGKGDMLIVRHLQYLRVDGPTPTLWTMAVGPAGWVLHLATAGAAFWWWHRCVQAENAAASVDNDVAAAVSV